MSKVKSSNKKILIIIFASLLLTFIGMILFIIFRGNNQQNLSTYSVYRVRETEPLIFEGKAHSVEEQEEYVDHSLGEISEIEVEDGEFVEEGTILFSYTSEENQQSLEEQNRLHNRASNRKVEEKTNLDSAQSELESAEANINEVNNQIENHTPSEDMEFGINQELESLQSNLATYESEKVEAKATIDRARLNIRELDEQLEDITAEIERLSENTTTSVEATVSGPVELNKSIVSRPEFSEEPFIRILSDDVIIEATVSEYDYNYLSEGSQVDIVLLNSEERINGHISYISNSPLSPMDSEDTSSRYLFKVVPEESIQHGFSVQISYQDGVIHIPESALVFEEEESYVFVNDEGVVHRKDVSVSEEGNIYVLKEGVSVDDELVLNPQPELEDGEEIVIVDD